ncbi:hypothetical protein POM88_021684 [Heracleum sosnowskyi]|uniref:Uncharacterized protein n=1 Tax=Heracleum sosnowskyi TaxID=360622 RepID=A0AAD8IDV1_9APIA|nr:hypothetical protein POM88_021684 [Heracleum sosnowskyi]
MNSQSVCTKIHPKDDPNRRPGTSTDPGWKYDFWPNIDKRDLVECSLSTRQMNGGFRDITICPKTTTELRKQMLKYILSKQKKKVSLSIDDGEDGDEDDGDQDDVHELHSSVGDSNFVKMPSFDSPKRKNRLEWKRLNDLVYVQYNRNIATRFEKLYISGKGFNPLVIEEFQGENEWVVDDPLWLFVDESNGASNANLPHNVPRAARGDLTYTQRRNHNDDVSSSKCRRNLNLDCIMSQTRIQGC